MPKKKVSPYRLGDPTTPNPMKEMSWCFRNHIIISIEPEGRKLGKYWEMTGRYQLVARQGNRNKPSGFIFDKDNVMDALYDAYRKTYQINYGKERKE